ncbi:MAG: HlyD family efflux transporter periplasmic adaptor subunit, partial [Pseudomonadota bacterium]|nr:HlyD family efflux transporter periplasmic adaptor subunit [Pseudomonadota bacterium]
AARAALELALAARETWLAELTAAEEAWGLAQEALADNAARAARLVLRAPVAGQVQALRVRAPGEVIEPGGAVADILPTEMRLAAEVRLSPLDIGHVAPGDPVQLKLTTFDEKRFGAVAGRVEAIAPTSSEDETGRTYFRVAVALDGQTIGQGGFERPLRAGMEARAEIETDRRSVLTYLLKPVERTLDQSFRER